MPISEALLLRHRISDLKRQITDVELSLPEPRRSGRNEDSRLRAARDFALSADTYLEGEFCDALREKKTRMNAYAEVIRGQVELDKLIYPDREPSVGWLDCSEIDYDADGQLELVVDTTFLRLYLEPQLGGALLEFDYKPRKANLCSVGAKTGEKSGKRALLSRSSLVEYPAKLDAIGEDFLQVLKQAKQAQSAWESSFLTLKKTPDVLGLRFNRVLTPNGSSELRLVKDFLFTSGIGAFLGNSTTGFSVEYSLQGEHAQCAGDVLICEWNLLVPSTELAGTALYLLGCVGGVEDKAYSPQEAAWVPGNAVPGGVFGVRIIDGVNSFTMDLRFTKALAAAAISPIRIALGDEGIQGFKLVFALSLEQLRAALEPTHLYLSIV